MCTEIGRRAEERRAGKSGERRGEMKKGMANVYCGLVFQEVT